MGSFLDPVPDGVRSRSAGTYAAVGRPGARRHRPGPGARRRGPVERAAAAGASRARLRLDRAGHRRPAVRMPGGRPRGRRHRRTRRPPRLRDGRRHRRGRDAIRSRSRGGSITALTAESAQHRRVGEEHAPSRHMPTRRSERREQGLGRGVGVGLPAATAAASSSSSERPCTSPQRSRSAVTAIASISSRARRVRRTAELAGRLAARRGAARSRPPPRRAPRPSTATVFTIGGLQAPSGRSASASIERRSRRTWSAPSRSALLTT